ncbi:MAG: efflux RND transporter periplasmic adaptor subunit [Candidatus Komeilibacteria bacterium]|nr:efflux RND transporter periplasmic adaptor subunit [Candidatus Komeilibacteria bacterium]
MKRIRRIVYSVIALAIVGAIGWNLYASKNKPVQYQTVPVAKMDLVQTVEATGSVASAQDLSLSFKTQGKIQEISVAIGDHVVRGATLASLADTSLSSQVDRARATLLSAQADLDKLLSGAKETEIAIGLEEVNKAQVDLDSVQATLENLLIDQDRQHQAYSATALQTLVDSAFVADYTNDVVFDGILDAQAQASFDTTKTQALHDAQVKYDQAKTLLQTAKAAQATAQQSQTDSLILDALQAMRTGLEAVSSLLDSSFEALSGAIVNSVYPQTTIDSLRSSFNTRASAVASSKTSVQSSINDFTTGLQSLASDLDAAAYKVKSAEQALALAQARYNALIAQPENYEIQQQHARVLQAEADVRSAQGNLGDTIMLAPVDGTITAIDAKVGEVASPTTAVIKMIGDSTLQIDVDIPESDIIKVALGQNAEISLDAFSADAVFKGTISFIEPTQRLIQGVVYYRVTVVFNEQNNAIKPGMTATVRIRTAERRGALTVPLRAVSISSSDGTRSVRMLEADHTVTTKAITTGIRGDDGIVEILSGLSEGENVIVGESK